MKRLAIGFLGWFGAGCAMAQFTGGMLNPDIDQPGQPFSYFRKSTDVLGALYAPVASELTPEGYVWTGFGDLMFFIGNPPEPVHRRLRTLEKGYLPVFKYDVKHDDVRFSFRVFAADLGGALAGVPVNFVEVTSTNEAREQRTGFLSSAFRHRGDVSGFSGIPDWRFNQKVQNIPAEFRGENGTAFDPNARYGWGDRAFLRNGRIVYSFPEAPYKTSLALADRGYRIVRFFSGEIEGNPNAPLKPDPHTPLGAAMYKVTLRPGASRSLWFKFPLAPVPAGSEAARELAAADPEVELRKTLSLWEDLMAKPPLRFPEAKVQDYLLTNTIVNLLAIDRIGDDDIVNVNKFHYHDPYGGANVVNMIRGYEYMGLLDIARRSLLYRQKEQVADGSFRMAKYPDHPYWELFGYNLWGWWRHYQLTGDREFLSEIYPNVRKAMAWHATITAADPLGLLPPAKIGDDAYLKDTRQTGQHMWVLVGLLDAIEMAKTLGETADEARYKQQYQRFRGAFDLALEKQTSQTGGYIPPGLDRTTRGNDWDNLLTLYPELLFDPQDPKVAATLKKTRAEYVEGILRYVHPHAVSKQGDKYEFNESPSLHYWQTPDNSENSLVRGTPDDQEWAVKELYQLLLHTSSTNMPGEYGTVPWSTREISSSTNLMPQGATSGKTIELLRNMLVREQDDDLYLFSALSPQWIQPGKVLEIAREPSAFGFISARLEAAAGELSVRLASQYRHSPEHLYLRVPWFFQLDKALADGKPVMAVGDRIEVPVDVRDVRLIGHIRTKWAGLSFQSTVDDYKREYKRRYDAFLRTGEIQP